MEGIVPVGGRPGAVRPLHLNRGWRLCQHCDCFIQVNLSGRFRKHWKGFKRHHRRAHLCKGSCRLAVPTAPEASSLEGQS